jgi:molybdopterin-biosynthesis enzyme MoeA-like protein
VIGGKILSGRTKDQNIAYIAEYLTRSASISRKCGWSAMRRARLSNTLNALRHATPMSSQPALIGPIHGDITAYCVAMAVGVQIDTDPRALAILYEWVKRIGAEMNEGHLRMTRISKGAEVGVA